MSTGVILHMAGVSIVIPAHNEADNIPVLLEKTAPAL